MKSDFPDNYFNYLDKSKYVTLPCGNLNVNIIFDKDRVKKNIDHSGKYNMHIDNPYIYRNINLCLKQFAISLDVADIYFSLI